MARPRLMTQSVGDITVVYLLDSSILDESNIKKISEELIDISDRHFKIKMLIDFQKVDYLSSAVLGKLVALYKKVKKGQIKAERIGRTFAISNKHVAAILSKALSKADKELIDKAVSKTVREYGQVLRRLGRE